MIRGFLSANLANHFNRFTSVMRILIFKTNPGNWESSIVGNHLHEEN